MWMFNVDDNWGYPDLGAADPDQVMIQQKGI